MFKKYQGTLFNPHAGDGRYLSETQWSVSNILKVLITHSQPWTEIEMTRKVDHLNRFLNESVPTAIRTCKIWKKSEAILLSPFFTQMKILRLRRTFLSPSLGLCDVEAHDIRCINAASFQFPREPCEVSGADRHLYSEFTAETLRIWGMTGALSWSDSSVCTLTWDFKSMFTETLEPNAIGGADSGGGRRAPR